MKRSVKFSINTVVTILMTLGISIIILMFSHANHKQFDLTQEKKFTLSDQSIKLVSTLNNDVEAIIFYSKGGDFQAQAENLLNLYKDNSKRFKVTLMETNKNPMEARDYKLTSLNSIVLKSGDRRELLTTVSEEALTNALIKVTQAGSKTVYFVTGHGEREIASNQFDQLQMAADALKKETYLIKSLNLTKEEKLPEDVNALIIAGPRSDFMESEIKKLQEYTNKGGAIFAMFDLTTDTPNLFKFFEDNGLTVDKDIILDALAVRAFGTPVQPIAVYYGTHPIVKEFKNVMTFYPRARSLTIDTKPTAKLKWEPIATTTEAAWAKPIDKDMGKIKPTFDAKTDRRGPLTIGAAATMPLGTPPPAPEGKPDAKRHDSRLIVFGNVEFANNQNFVQVGNGNMFLNSVSWLTEQENLISIRPKQANFTPLNLTNIDKRNIFILSVIVLPVLVIIIGVLVFINKNI